MIRFIIPGVLYLMLSSIEAGSQPSTQKDARMYTYHRPTADKESWQRLNLWLSSTFILAVKEGQVDLDSCLAVASRSLGMSRYAILAEGMDDPQLQAQSKWMDQRDPGTAVRLLSTEKGKKQLQLLILLGAYYAFQPGSYFLYKDSVNHFLQRAINLSKDLKEERLGRIALCLLGKIYIQVNDKKGDSIYNRLIDDCRKVKDKQTEARVIAYRGIYTIPMPATFPRKIEDFQTAAALYQSLGDTENEINMLTDIGYLMIVSGQLQAGYDVFLKALQKAEGIGYPYLHYNTDALALNTIFQGKFGEPLRYILQTIKIAEACRDSIGLAYFYSRLSLLYQSEGREKESMELAQKAIDRFIIDRNPAVFGILNDVIIYLADQGRQQEALELTLDIATKVNTPVTFSDQFSYHLALSNCYINLNNPDLAEKHVVIIDSMETKAEAIRGPMRRALVNDQYGNVLMIRKQYKKAKEYLEKHFVTTSIAQRVLSADLLIYRRLIRIDSILGDKTSQISHYEKYIQLLDSNFQVQKVRQAEELDVLYETQEKEQQIASLHRQAQLEKDNLEQATLVKNLTIAGIIATMIIAGLLFYQNRLKQKNNNLMIRKNEQLQHLLTDKEWLLKEVHHRVKNNLQIVMSLLNSQSAYINNDAALTAIHDSQHRVHAMSLIHQKLYSGENVSSINMSFYIRELVTYLRDSFDAGRRIHFDLTIDPIELDVSQAVPLGLILNEAITNSIKYAFPGDREGVISISLTSSQPNKNLLEISDNGIGMPVLNNKKAGSLGMSLMEGLSEDLDGNFSIENNNGTIIKISFVGESRLKRTNPSTPSFASNS